MLNYTAVVLIVTVVPLLIIVGGFAARMVFMDSTGHIPHPQLGLAGPNGNVKAVFGHLDTLLTAIDRAKKAGFHDFTVMSPLPRHEIEELIYEGRPSPVRWWTLLAGATGGTGGFTLACLTSAVWPMTLPGGKPVISVPPFVIITFECTVLIGGLMTLAAIIYHCRLPAFDLPIECCDPRFTSDKFGMVIHGVTDTKTRGAITELLNAAGADEVAADLGQADLATAEA